MAEELTGQGWCSDNEESGMLSWQAQQEGHLPPRGSAYGSQGILKPGSVVSNPGPPHERGLLGLCAQRNSPPRASTLA